MALTLDVIVKALSYDTSNFLILNNFWRKHETLLVQALSTGQMPQQ